MRQKLQFELIVVLSKSTLTKCNSIYPETNVLRSLNHAYILNSATKYKILLNFKTNISLMLNNSHNIRL